MTNQKNTYNNVQTMESNQFAAWIGKKSGQLRVKNTKRTDIRVKIMNEILLGIQVIKMYAWEKSFAKMVDKIRK